MPALPRVVATDLDGTLLRTDGTVSARTVAALEAAASAGILTVLVTARPPRWLDDLTHVVGSHGIAICGNGAFVYDVARRTVVESHGFTRAEVLALVRDLRVAVPGATFAAERASGPWVDPAYPDPHRDSGVSGAVRAPLEDLDEEPVGKLLALEPTVPVEQLLATVADVVGERGVLAYSGAFDLAEINPPGVTKASGLAAWCAERGVGAEDVWAFGDMPNDLPMLRWAGRGYAVGNAHPEVLAAASHTTETNDEDGVAAVLEGLLAAQPEPFSR